MEKEATRISGSIYERAARWEPEHTSMERDNGCGRQFRDLIMQLRSEHIPEQVVQGVAEHLYIELTTLNQLDETLNNIQAMRDHLLQTKYQISPEAERARLAICKRQLATYTAQSGAYLDELKVARQAPVFDQTYRRFAALYAPLGERLTRQAQTHTFVLPLEQVINGTYANQLQEFVMPALPEGSFLFIRHYMTSSNKEGKLASPDDPLLPEERERARRDAEVLKDLVDNHGHEYDGIISSPLTRALETAQIYAEVLGFTSITIFDDLREREYTGEFAGQSYAHLREVAGDNNIITTEFDELHLIDHPGMEHPIPFKVRGKAQGERLIQRYQGKHMLLVSHGSMLMALLPGIDLSYDQAFHNLIQLPGGKLKNGGTIHVSYPSTATYFAHKHNRTLSPLPNDSPIWGTPLEGQLRALREKTLRDPLATIQTSDLTGAQYYHLSNDTYRLEAEIQHDRLFPGDQSQLTIEVLGKNNRRIARLTKLASREIYLEIRDREQFPQLANFPPPAPYNEFSELPYAHHWTSWGTEKVGGYLGDLPPEVLGLVEQLAHEANQAFGLTH